MTIPPLRYLALALPLLAGSLTAQTATLATVQDNGSRSTRVNLVFLSEGYTSSQMGTFATDVQTAVNYLFTREPWNRYQSYCNVFRIQVASNQSGTDNGTGGGARDTYFGTGFNTPGIPQSVTIGTTGSTRAYSLLNTHIPEYDIPVILVNDSKYGGTGGPLAVVTTNGFSPQILEHELGHSFAKLTDEYDEAYAGFPATEFPNATAKTARNDIRWKLWIEPSTAIPTGEDPFSPDHVVVGLYEGANYRSSGWYRPHDNALMRNLNQQPGSVTREALVLSYYSKVGMIDASAPTASTITHTAPAPLTFNLTLKSPSQGPALTVEWRVDNVTQGQNGATFTANSRDIGNGTHTVKAIVRDTTPWVRRDPSGLLVEEKTWTLQLSNQTDPPVITNPLPAVSVLPTTGSLTLDANSTGPGSITYQWLKNNLPLKPAVTTPTLTLSSVSLATAGTYTAKVSNPGHTISHSCRVAVIDTANIVNKVVVGAGRTATLSFPASSNLPPVTWFKIGNGGLVNGPKYVNATTKALQIKTVNTGDSGDYAFSIGDYNSPAVISLLVTTGKTDYTGQTVTLPTGIVAGSYDQFFPAPNNALLTPNSYSAVKLPKGLVIHPKTGRITGIPTFASVDQTNGDEVSFTVGNEFGKIPVKVRMLIKPLPPGVSGSFAGVVYVGSNLGATTGGRMAISVTSAGSYTGSAVIGTETLRIQGMLRTLTPSDTTAAGTLTLKPKHLSSPLSRTFTITDSLDSDPTTAMLSDNTTNFQLWRNKWAAPESIDPYAGYHTFHLTPSTNPDAPEGYGFGSVRIDSNGTTTATGLLPDGASFATTSHLTPEGAVFIYQTLYATAAKGSFVAFLDLDVGPPAFFNTGNSISNWFRPADTRPVTSTVGRAFRAGFGLGTAETPLPVGGLYVPPASSAIPMELDPGTGSPASNAQLIFQQLLGDDLLAVVPDVTLDLKPGSGVKVNLPTPNKATTFSITPADGRFKGSYTTVDADPRPPLAPSTTARPAIKRKVDYQGIIVREAGVQKGFGYHLRYDLPKADGSTTPTNSPQNSGTVKLMPSP